MKKIIYLIVVFFTNVLICNVYSEGQEQIPDTFQNLPIIKVDDAHWAKERKDGKKALIYNIPEGEGFILDTNKYAFNIPAPLNEQPTGLILLTIGGQDYQYGITWETNKQKYVVTSETLKPLSGSRAFPGFKSGQEIVITVGYYSFAGGGTYYPLWYAFIKII